jgi:predicted NAD/FAD-binding protein
MKVAVVGSGISGMAAAWLLARKHEVHLFEKRGRLGGHTHTVVHDVEGRRLPLDTGFIVYNESTYPNLTRVFSELEIETRASDMSFSVSCADPDIEFASHGLRGLFARRSLAFSPAYLRMLLDIVRFGRRGRRVLSSCPDPDATIADFLADGGFSDAFARYYLLPMTAAIWSSGSDLAASYPRDPLLRFLDNHGLLQVTGQPEWRTVVGGSRSYIEPMTRSLGERIHTGKAVTAIGRGAGEVEIRLEDGSNHLFDRVVIAAHADQALAMLAEPTSRERDLLGSWRYSVNDTWLHSDSSMMPRRTDAWASWNYRIPDTDAHQDRPFLSYHLNRLQGLAEDREYLVTLNPDREPDPESVIRRMTYTHPIYTRESVSTQADLPSLNGPNRTHFCGAYFGNGFHEDGLKSAIAVAEEFGVTL